MRFDPALEAQAAFKEAGRAGELGDEWEQAVEAEEVFSSCVGPEARAAYDTLQRIGARHPDAPAFQEFLIFITWQQAAEETIALHFKTGVELCDRYLERLASRDGAGRASQVREIRASFRAGLGLEAEDDTAADYDRDSFKGGD